MLPSRRCVVESSSWAHNLWARGARRAADPSVRSSGLSFSSPVFGAVFSLSYIRVRLGIITGGIAHNIVGPHSHSQARDDYANKSQVQGYSLYSSQKIKMYCLGMRLLLKLNSWVKLSRLLMTHLLCLRTLRVSL